MRRIIAAASISLFLAGFVWSVLTKEEQLKSGDTLIVHLAPRDPRAFLLGDYMDLDYAINREVDKALYDQYIDGQKNTRTIARNRREVIQLPRDGVAIVRLNASNIASFIRLDDGSPLQDDERRLYFRVRGGDAKIAASAFYFQEGYAKDFDRAQYGELRVDANGKSLLVHMLDSNLERIQPQKTKIQE